MNTKKKTQVLFVSLYFDVLAGWHWLFRKKSPYQLPQVLAPLSFLYCLSLHCTVANGCVAVRGEVWEL